MFPTAERPSGSSSKSVAAIGEVQITSFILAMYTLSLVAFTVGWFKGGHPERFGVAVVLFHGVADELYCAWRLVDADHALRVAVAGEQAIGRIGLTLIFGWLAFRSPRWWPLGVMASLVLILLVHLLTIMAPIPYNAGVSARVGLWMILYAILLAGVVERWMAGEAPVSRIGRDGLRETVEPAKLNGDPLEGRA